MTKFRRKVFKLNNNLYYIGAGDEERNEKSVDGETYDMYRIAENRLRRSVRGTATIPGRGVRVFVRARARGIVLFGTVVADK